MGFDSGTMTYTRFDVIGDLPRTVDQATLDKFAALALREEELTTAEIDYGWCGPRHVMDGDFTAGNCVFNDCLFIGLRIDTNRVPAEIKKAYVALEETASAAGNPSGFVSRKQKRDARETAKRKIEEDLASGKFRRSKIIPILWDLQRQTVFAPVAITSAEQLIELFERTLNAELQPVTSGSECQLVVDKRGARRLVEDINPTRFATLPGDPPAEYPWVATRDMRHDYLGNEFLIWLWFVAAKNAGVVQISDAGECMVMFSRTMQLDCSFGQTGKIAVTFEDPTAMIETLDAIRSGKVPRKAGITLAVYGHLFTFQLAAETLAISGLKLPEIEKADSPRVLFEERITLLRDFNRALHALFATFISYRTSDSWGSIVDQIRRWQAGKGKAA